MSAMVEKSFVTKLLPNKLNVLVAKIVNELVEQDHRLLSWSVRLACSQFVMITRSFGLL